MEKTFRTERRLKDVISLVFKSIFILSILFTFSSVEVSAQDAKIRSLNKKIENAEKQHQRNLTKFQEGDSLITSGTRISNQSAIEVDKITAEMDRKTDQYKAQKKALARNAKTASQEDLTQLQLYEREIDNQYRADLREYDVQMRSTLKESDKGSSAAIKGKQFKKDAQKRLKQSSKQLAKLKDELAKLTNSLDNVADNR